MVKLRFSSSWVSECHTFAYVSIFTQLEDLSKDSEI